MQEENSQNDNGDSLEDEDDLDPLEKKLNAVYPDVKPYKLRPRDMGTGDIRVDNPFNFREDMYSLLFISMVKPIYK